MAIALIKFSANWADEMDIDGLFTISMANWEARKTTAAAYFEKHKSLTYTIGRNMEINFDSYDDWLNAHEIITEDLNLVHLGVLAIANFMPIGFTGPDFYDDDNDDDYDDYASRR